MYGGRVNRRRTDRPGPKLTGGFGTTARGGLVVLLAVTVLLVGCGGGSTTLAAGGTTGTDSGPDVGSGSDAPARGTKPRGGSNSTSKKREPGSAPGDATAGQGDGANGGSQGDGGAGPVDPGSGTAGGQRDGTPGAGGDPGKEPGSDGGGGSGGGGGGGGRTSGLPEDPWNVPQVTPNGPGVGPVINPADKLRLLFAQIHDKLQRGELDVQPETAAALAVEREVGPQARATAPADLRPLLDAAQVAQDTQSAKPYMEPQVQGELSRTKEFRRIEQGPAVPADIGSLRDRQVQRVG